LDSLLFILDIVMQAVRIWFCFIFSLFFVNFRSL
jgi:hypothetical protein